MQETRKIVYYPDVKLPDLDAGVCIAYPLPNGNHKYYAVPSFLVIGAAKCGTTEIRNWLSIHPNLRSLSSEAHFFDEVLNLELEWPRYIFNPAFVISKNLTHFLSHQNIHTIEKTPAYFHKSNRGVPVPALIQKMMPSGKFIVILRNPSERAYSAYQMGRRVLKVRDVRSDCMENDFLTFIEKVLFSRKNNQKKGYFTAGHYAEHLENWLKYFSRKQLGIVLLEDFRQNPFQVMDYILNFLELPYLDYRPIVEKNFRNLWVLKQEFGKKSKANDFPYEPMSKAAKELLDTYYAPWNKKLKKLMPYLDFNW